MLVILEGPDGAGKSWLADKLERRINSLHPGEEVVRLHAKPPKQHPLDEYETPLFDYRPNTQVHVICDRWHWGEIVYPKVFGRDTLYDEAVHTHVEMFLQSRGAIVVYVYDDVETMMKRVGPDRDAFVRPEHIRALTVAYNDVTLESRLPVVMWKQCRVDIDSIIARAQRSEKSASILSPFTTYVGPVTPTHLLLGENRNTDVELAPAFGPYPATSGHYLFSNLQLRELGSMALGVANACDVDDIARLLDVLNNPWVVTLGGVAHKCLTPIRRLHGAVPHPQYIRRFHFKYGQLYGRLINRAFQKQEDMRSWRPS